MSQARQDFVQGIYEFDALVKRLNKEDWSRPTPCDRWNVHQLVKHVAFAAFMTSGIAQGRTAVVLADHADASTRPAPLGGGLMWSQWLVDYNDEPLKRSDSEAADAWRAEREGLLASLDACDVSQATMSLWGHDSVDSWLVFASGDPVAHSWDLAKAVGAPVVIEENIAARCLAAYTAFDTEGSLRMTNTLGPVLSTDPRQSAVERLVSFTGRAPEWVPSP